MVNNLNVMNLIVVIIYISSDEKRTHELLAKCTKSNI